jgi:hypothetical protein
MSDSTISAHCYICETGDSSGQPPVASCERCGALICLEHSHRLVHHPDHTPPGMWSPARREQAHFLEIICVDCHRAMQEGLEAVRLD